MQIQPENVVCVSAPSAFLRQLTGDVQKQWGRMVCLGEERQMGRCCSTVPAVHLPTNSHFLLCIFKPQGGMCSQPVALYLCVCICMCILRLLGGKEGIFWLFALV